MLPRWTVRREEPPEALCARAKETWNLPDVTVRDHTGKLHIRSESRNVQIVIVTVDIDAVNYHLDAVDVHITVVNVRDVVVKLHTLAIVAHSRVVLA